MVVQPAPQNKADWRTAMKARLQELPQSQRHQEETDLVVRLKGWAGDSRFNTVLATQPLGVEPDLVLFYQWWLAGGGRLAFARTSPDHRLGFRYVRNLDGPWETHRWGLREPAPSCEPWVSGKALCLVPGLAFARHGVRVARLGRGGGFYDRWLAENDVFTIGVGYSVQSVKALPVEEHDRSLDGLMIAGLPLYAAR